MTAAESDALAKNYDTYARETTAKLGALAAGEFTPDLARLDALVESLNISASADQAAQPSAESTAGAGVQLANPASVNCAIAGGEYTVIYQRTDVN